ncbi:gliding motility lipoprotein GldB [Aureisphaera galaxeae]|uniref:gliding motility lipoprotein GldB n=1 Tax=Aureisphaera galaxeae TaxID=1538023 RepID=UPI00234FBA7B|nr:gliding motility lipoprotein GldB [Aureisphaera galaxeae]MDC8003189.1 gliding motility lipoprotein GldB [Aureisphaera galaxeae]
MKKYLFGILLAILVLGCNSKSKTEQEIAKVPVDFELIRFDKIFGKASIADLPNLKVQYPLFFPKQYHDSIWIGRMNDTLQQQLNEAVTNVFPNEDNLIEGLTDLFQHIRYYHSDFTVPKVYTATSDVDYKTKVIAQDTLLVIELDTYLGSEHPFYEGISKYITKNMQPDAILSDVAMAYSKKYVAVPKQRSLLAQMVYFGKGLYLKDLWLPELTNAQKIGYTEGEMLWADENEVDIWRYFVENELLYSTDAKLPSRFINPAPFSKFNLELDNESPGMIGRYVGWQIVKSFAENNEVSLQELMRMEPDELFKNSKYKPKK